MKAVSLIPQKKSNVPAKTIALPVEHGAWGFLFEPLLGGLILAPSLAAPWIALFVVGGFLMRQPLKFLLGDLRLKRRLPRTDLALRFVSVFGGITVIGLLGMSFFAPLESFIPFVIIAPLVVYLIAQDVARQSRHLLPELLASFALASSIAAVALADGFAYQTAFALWAIMLARLIPSVLYVRSRLRLEKGKETSKFPPIAAHILALAATAALAFAGLIPFLPVLMLTFLAVRAATGLSDSRRKLTAKAIGIREVIYGALYVLSILFGYFLNL